MLVDLFNRAGELLNNGFSHGMDLVGAGVQHGTDLFILGSAEVVNTAGTVVEAAAPLISN